MKGVIKLKIEIIISDNRGKKITHVSSEGIKSEKKFGKKENFDLLLLKYIENYCNESNFELVGTSCIQGGGNVLYSFDKFFLVKK